MIHSSFNQSTESFPLFQPIRGKISLCQPIRRDVLFGQPILIVLFVSTNYNIKIHSFLIESLRTDHHPVEGFMTNDQKAGSSTRLAAEY